LSENTIMKSLFSSFVLIASLWAHFAFAQPNVLGLPIVPQNPINEPVVVQGAATAASAASAPKGAKGARAVRPKGGASSAAAPSALQVNDADAKSVLNGGVTMATSYTGTLATLRITTNTQYQDETQRKTALTAGRLVQRDLYMACAKQCKPAQMAAPKILPDNKLQFELVINGFNRVINQDDMISMLLGRPLAVVAASPPLVRDPPKPPVLPDAVQMTRSITPSSPTYTEPTK
jgi:hypothetical protein